MSRILEELPCGCLVGDEGLMPCCYEEEDATDLYKRCMQLFYKEGKTVEEIKAIIESEKSNPKIGDFWYEWLKEKQIRKPAKVEELARDSLQPFLRDNDDVTVHAVASLINGYFEDLIEELEEH